MIQSFVQIVSSSEQRKDVLELLFLLNGVALGTPGCLRCGIYQDLLDKDSLVMLQEWEYEARFQKFIRSVEFRKVLALLELSKEPPEVRFNTISASGGMEIIRQAKATSDS